MTAAFVLILLSAGSAAFNLTAAGVFYAWMARQQRKLSTLRRTGRLPSLPETGRNGLTIGQETAGPEVVVILCVRGDDPFLSDTLRSLARQDYPHYRILVVVDHRSDPAWRIVSAVKSELGLHDSQLELQDLTVRRERCGLKCSALLQACESLSFHAESTERVIVTIDSDAVPSDQWLSQLIRPLADPQVGATTSNQWFEPNSAELGSWVRAVWQAGAIVPTAILGNPWAGSFAIRMADLQQSGLLDAWRTSIIDDGPVRSCLNRLRKRIEFVPQNMVINREDCGLRFCFRYIARMLTWSRLFESTFWLTGLHAAIWFATFALLVGWCLTDTAVLALWALGLSQPPLAGLWAWGALLLWWGGQVTGFVIVRSAVRGLGVMAPARARPSASGLRRGLACVMAIPLAMIAYAAGCLTALRVKKVVWRNIAYQIEGGHRIRMIEYSPFAAENSRQVEHHSI